MFISNIFPSIIFSLLSSCWSRSFLSIDEIHAWLTKDGINWDVVCISDLEEAALPLEEYASLRDFFVRTLKEGCRPIDPDPFSLVTGNEHLGRVYSFICFTLKYS